MDPVGRGCGDQLPGGHDDSSGALLIMMLGCRVLFPTAIEGHAENDRKIKSENDLSAICRNLS